MRNVPIEDLGICYSVAQYNFKNYFQYKREL